MHPSNPSAGTATETRVEIPQPKALPGDEVSVRNYRMWPALWEHGTCAAAKFTIRTPSGGYWSYDVTLHRLNKHGRAMWLYVTDEGIDRDDE